MYKQTDADIANRYGQETSLGNDADKETRKATRMAFERLKKTPGYGRWRIAQVRHQKGLCAW